MLPSLPSKHSSQGKKTATSPRIDSSGYRTELLLPPPPDHFFDVVTNSIGLVTAVSALRYYWWIDPTGKTIASFFFSRGFLQFLLEQAGSATSKFSLALSTFVSSLLAIEFEPVWLRVLLAFTKQSI
ncbi:hypothetical protein NC651_020091 [Populus alba x Populus x berolinensis]|nr:hypothetical protein NC651_020091 [Populus alba x Populus x berolinensis]